MNISDLVTDQKNNYVLIIINNNNNNFSLSLVMVTAVSHIYFQRLIIYIWQTTVIFQDKAARLVALFQIGGLILDTLVQFSSKMVWLFGQKRPYAGRPYLGILL